MRSNREARFQLTFAGLHLYAAVIAVVAVILHAGAVRYHVSRLLEEV